MLQVDVSCDDPDVAAAVHFVRGLLGESFKRMPESPDGTWGVSVRLAGHEEIAELHARFFGDPTDTDVMSFPSGDDLENNGGYLGDIAISLDTAKLQATEQGHSHEREIAFLALHGLLHLLGFDDATSNERDEMLSKQTELLTAFEERHGRIS